MAAQTYPNHVCQRNPLWENNTRLAQNLGEIAGIVLFFLFFQPIIGLHLIKNILDTDCYVLHLLNLIGIPTETLGHCIPRYYRQYMIGTSILWAPLAFLAKTIASITHTDVYEWVEASIGFSASFFLVLSLRLMSGLMIRIVPNAGLAVVGTVLFFFASNASHYFFNFPTMAHASEFFLLTLYLVSFFNNLFAISIIVSFFVVLTRLNDLPQLLMLMANAWEKRQRWLNQHPLSFCFAIAIIGLLAVTFVIVIIFGYSSGEYGGTLAVSKYLSRYFITGQSLKKWGFFLFALPNGTVYTATWLFALLAVAFIHVRKLSLVSIASLIWILLILLFCVGGLPLWYLGVGYRYLIGPYFAGFIIWAQLHPQIGHRERRVLWVALVINVVMLILMHLIYVAPHSTRIYVNLAWLNTIIDSVIVSLFYSPWPVLLISLFPSFISSLVTGGTLPHLQGPPLWVLICMLVIASIRLYFLVRQVFRVWWWQIRSDVKQVSLAG